MNGVYVRTTQQVERVLPPKKSLREGEGLRVSGRFGCRDFRVKDYPELP